LHENINLNVYVIKKIQDIERNYIRTHSKESFVRKQEFFAVK